MSKFSDDGIVFDYYDPKDREEYMEWVRNGQEEQYYYNKPLSEICQAYLEYYDAMV